MMKKPLASTTEIPEKYGRSLSIEEVESLAQEKQNTELIGVGALLASCSVGTRPLTEVEQTKLNPISPTLKQLLLGTALGDGCMTFSEPQSGPLKGIPQGRYRGLHGAKQTKYCLHKAELLSDYINTAPRVSRNAGFGRFSLTFATLTTPALGFMRDLCYVPNPERPDLWKKEVTRDWLDQLTWEGIAWWYLDDGTLTEARTVNLATNAYSLEAHEIMKTWFQEKFALDAIIVPRKYEDRQTTYSLRLNVEDSRIFITNVKPYCLPGMEYKVELPTTHKCRFCGAPCNQPGIRADNPACLAPACRKKAQNESEARSRARTGKEEINRRQREREELQRATDPTYREKRNAAAKKRFEDPECKAKANAAKREWRRKRKEAGLPRM
jgi:hypothetical protein